MVDRLGRLAVEAVGRVSGHRCQGAGLYVAAPKCNTAAGGRDRLAHVVQHAVAPGAIEAVDRERGVVQAVPAHGEAELERLRAAASR